jgi:hypothetical protein
VPDAVKDVLSHLIFGYTKRKTDIAVAGLRTIMGR